jgi:GTP pyrophosphokinase
MIRTETMHRNAEYGITAAYRFPGKERPPKDRPPKDRPGHERNGRNKPPTKTSATRAEHLSWLHRVVEWQRDAIDPVQFLDALRCDLTESQIHVFVGQVRLLLPAGATPVDVAYAVGDEAGAHCVAASVNGQLAPLSSELNDGDTVEIHTADSVATTGSFDITAPTAPDGSPLGPSPEWLTFVRTPHAQLQITRWLDEHGEQAAQAAPAPVPLATKLRMGQAAIALTLRQRERGLADSTPLLAVAAELGFPDVDALFVSVADKRHNADEIVDRMIEWTDSRSGPPRP